jgi:RimJ/RimL family protein N-acetyltransferase
MVKLTVPKSNTTEFFMILKNEFNQIIGNEISEPFPKESPPKVRMHGTYCILEPLDIARHSSLLFDALLQDNDGSSWTYLPYGPFDSCAEFQDWLTSTTSESDTILYAILDSKNQAPIGISGYLRINPEHGVIEVGHLHFSKLLQKTPAATEAMYLMMNYAFETLKYRRYEWKCNSLNQASKDAALRLGFTYEGTFRQSNVYKNRNRDTAWFSILDHEWPNLKKKLEQWLEPSNFDMQGKQKISLRAI